MYILSNKICRFSILLIFLVLTGWRGFTQNVNNYTLCKGDNNILTPNLGNPARDGKGFWKIIQGYGTFNDSTSHSSVVISNIPFGTSVFNFYQYNIPGNPAAGTFHEHTLNVDNLNLSAGRDTTLCYTVNSYQLNGSDPSQVGATFVGTWSVVSGSGTFANKNLYNTTVTGMTVGVINTYQWQLNKDLPGCNGVANRTDNVNITIPAPPNAFAGNDQTICPGNSATLTATAGAGYKYNWSTGQTTQSITVSPAASVNYKLTVTDANGCKASDDANIFVNTLSSFNLTSNATSYCPGGNVTLSLSGSEIGVNYQLKNGAAFDGSALAGTGGVLSWVNKTAGTYTVVATNPISACTKIMNGSVVVTVNPVPVTYNLTASSLTYCSYTSGVTLTLSGSENGANFQYQLYKNGIASGTPSAGNGGILTWANTSVGNYSVITTNTLTTCTSNMTGTPSISSLASPSLFNVGGAGAFCELSGGLPVTLDGSEIGMNYQLVKDGLNSGGLKAGTGGVLTWAGNLAGTYTIQATNGGGTCTRPMNGNAILSQISLPTVFNLSTNTLGYCTGGNGVTLTLSGSQVGIDYVLLKNGISASVVSGTGAPLIWPNMSSGTYTVQAKTTGATVCTINMVGTYVITAYPLPIANAGADKTICQKGSVQMSASGGTSYSWSPSTGLSNATVQNPMANPMATVLYTVTVTDANGCSATDDVSVTVNVKPVANLSAGSSTICAGDSTQLTVTGGITYLWNTAATTSSIWVKPTTSTPYWVIATNAFGCKDTANLNLVVNPKPSVNAGADVPLCKGASTILTATGADTYVWSNGAVTASVTVSPTLTTTFTVTGKVTATNCQASDNVVITVNSIPSATFTLNGGVTTQFCINSPVVTLAGNPNTGGTFSSSIMSAIAGNFFDPSEAGVGSHTITYTYTDSKSCTNSSTTNVTVIALPVVNISGLNTSYCNNNAAVAITGSPLHNGSGVYGTWIFSGPPAALTDNGNGMATFTPSAINASGNYTVTYQVANSGGCFNSISKTVLINLAPTVSFVGLPVNICQNSPALTLTGNMLPSGTFSGSGITDNGNGTAVFNASSLSPNNYTITYTYQDPVTFCTSSVSKVIMVKLSPSMFSMTGGGSYCQGAGGLAVGLSNSTAAIDYELFLNGFSTSQIILGTGGALNFGNKTSEGTYTIIATNPVNSCSQVMNGNAAIIMNPLPADAQVITGVTQVCPGASENYSVPAIASATTYNWQLPVNAFITAGTGTNAVTIYFPPNAVSGNVIVTGQNACGNGLSSTLAVTVLPLPSTAGAITGKATICQGEKNIVYSITALGNTTSYSWTVPSGATLVSGQGTTQIIVNYTGTASSGNVTVKGVNSCGNGISNSKAVTVVDAPQLSVNAPSGQITCAGTPVTVSATSTTAGVSFAWLAINGGHIAAGAGTPNPSVDATGDYIITLTEPVNSCTSIDTVTVLPDNQVPQNVNITSTNLGVVSCTVSQVTLTTSTTSVFPIGYTWSASAGGHIVSGANTASVVVDKGGVYDVKVTNLNNSCFTSKSINVTESISFPNLTVVDPETENLTCSHTTVTLASASTTSGVTYNWSGPGTIINGTTATPIVDAVGIYTLLLKAPNGCTTTKTVQVLPDYSLPTVNVNVPANLTCINATVTLNGSSTTAGGTLLWSGPGIVSGSTTQTPVVNLPGNYTLTVFHPVTGCTNAKTVNVLQDLTAPVINFPVVPTPITCAITTSGLTSNIVPAASTLVWTGPGSISNTAITNPTVNAPGSYSLTATHPVTGCTSNRSLTIADGRTPADASIASPSVITCTDPSMTLLGNTSILNYSALWSTTNGNISGPNTNLNVVVTKAGLYTLTITNNTSGCSASQNVTVTADATAPDITVDKNPALLTCAISQVQLYGASITAGTTLAWTGPAGSNITDPTTQRPKVDAIGIYTLTVSAPNGCTSSDIVTVSQDKTMPAVPSILAPQQLTCSRTSVQVEVSPLRANSDYLWSTSGSGNITNGASPIASVDATGPYTVKITDRTSGCSRQNTVTVSMDNTTSTAAITGGPYTVSCAAPAIILDGSTSTGINPVWSASLGGHIVSGGNTFKPTIDAAGTYTITTADAITGCTNSASISVTSSGSLPTLTINAFPAKLTCSVTTVSLFGQPTEAGTTFTWTASPGHFVSGAGTSTPVVDQPGTYILTVTKTATGCVNTAAIQVQQDIAAPLLALSSPAKITCAINMVQLNASTTAASASYAWSTGGTGTIKPGDNNVSNPTVLSIGTYTVTLTDLSNQCTTIGNVTVTDDKITPNVNVDKNPLELTCTRLDVVLSGNSLTAGVTYQWSTGGTGNIVNPTSKNPRVDAPGTYDLTITNPLNGCTVTDNVTVVKDITAPNIWVDPNPAELNCVNNTVKVSGNSITPTVTYAWSGPGIISDPTLKAPTVDAPGVYTLTVTSTNNNCVSSSSVTVTRDILVPASPIANSGSACFSAPASVLSATGNGIKWYSNATLLPAAKLHDGNNFTPTVTLVGNYSYFVTQTGLASQCESPSTQVNYSVLALPAAPGNTDKAICEGTPNPALQAAGSNISWYDNPGGSFLGSGGLYTPPASVSTAGTYTYYATQTDANNCQSLTTPVKLIINANPSKPVMDKLSANICLGTPHPSFTASGNNIKWYDNSLLALPIATTNTYTPTVNAVGVYPYYITQTSAQGCTSVYETVIFTITGLPQIFNITDGGTYCDGQSGLVVGLDGSENLITYQLILDGTSVVASTNGNGSAFNFGFQKTSGNYSIVATGATGCQSVMNGSVPIVSTPLPTAAGVITGPLKVCQGVKAQIYTVPPIANTTSYVWTVPPGATIFSGQGTNTIVVDYGVASVSGLVSVKGSNMCGLGTISTLNINVVATPQLTLNTSPPTITCSLPTITLSASSSTPGATFAWTPINGGHIASGAATASPNIDAAGDYMVTVTELLNSCKTQGTVTVPMDIQAPQNLNITASNGGIVTCSSPNVTLSATTTSVFPLGYNWIASSGGHLVSGGTTANVSVDKPGVYDVVMTNLNTGCTSTKSITIAEQKILPDIAVIDPAPQKLTCTQLSVTLSGSSVTPGVVFNWTGPGAIINANTTTPTVSTAGIYTFTVSAPNGCTSLKTVQVSGDISLPNITVNTNPPLLTCSSTTITLNGSSTTVGALLQWSGPGIVSGADTETPGVNVPGVYKLTVYHPLSGCNATALVTVSQDITAPAISFPVIPATLTCALPQTTVIGSTPITNPTYLWTTGNGTIVSGSNSVSVVVSKAGTYMLSVTNNDNGCSANASIIVTANQNSPDAQITNPATINCTTPSITITGSSITTPVSVNWTTTNGAIAAGLASFTPSVTKGGTYIMTVTNTLTGCIGSASITVTEDKAKPVISIDKSPATLSCGFPLVSLNGTAPGSSLQWTGPATATILNNTSPTPTINKAGRYYLTATGVNGCFLKDSTDVPGNFLKPQNVVINAPGTLNCTNPALQLTGSSSTVNALFAWSAIAGGNIISSTVADIITIDAPGTYKMMVTHPSSLCKDSAIAVVSQDLSAPTITFPVIPVTITCTQTTSTLNGTINPANSLLHWTGPGTISNPVISNPMVNAAGVYTLTATHPITGCNTVRTLTVPEDKTSPVITITAPAVITCTLPTVTIHSTTTTSNYTALWTTSNGAISGAANLLDVIITKAGLYTLTLTDNTTGCSTSKSVLATSDITKPDIMVDKNPAQLTCKVLEVELFGSSTTPTAIYAWTGPGNITGINTQRPKVDAIGDYILTITSANGCFVKDTITVTDNKTVPAVPNILAPTVLTCSRTTVNLEVSPLPVNVDYVWSTTGAGNITNGNTAIATVDAIGPYKVVVTERTSGCTSQNTVTVAESKTTSTAIVIGGPFAMSCSHNLLTLDGRSSTGITPVWTASQGGHIVSGANTFVAKVDAPGMYTLTVSDAVTGCFSSTNIPVLSALDLPTLSVNAYPLELTCSVTSVTLQGQPTQVGTIFTWTASPGNIVSGINSFNPVVDQAGTYILTVTDTVTGCVNTASIQVIENTASPLLVIATPAKFTCSVNQVQLNASSTNTNVTYSWSTSGAGSIKPGDINVSNPVVLSPATYIVTLTDFVNQCTTLNSVVVAQDKTLPDINVDKNPAQLTCITKQVILSGNSLTTGAIYQWTTTGAGNILNSLSKSPRVDAIGYYKLLVSNPVNGCSAIDSVQVTNDLSVPNIWVDTKPDTLNCAVSSVKIRGNSSTLGVTYAWTGAGNISDATLKEPDVDAPGTYYLTVTSSVNGCTSTLAVDVVRNITVPASPIIPAGSACFGMPASTLTATGNNIKWYSDATLTPAVLIHSGNTFTPATLNTVGGYNFFVTQTDAHSQCESPAAQANYAILALPAPPVNIDNAVCQGFPNTVLQASGTNIQWYVAPGGVLLASGPQYTPPLSVSATGTYTYFATQTDGNGCQSLTRGVNLIIRANPAKPLVDKLTAGVCQGLVNPTFTASGNDIKWYANSSLPAPIKTGSSLTSLETVAGIYNYYVTQTSTYGCVSPYETVTFTIKPLPQKFITTGGGVYCENLNGLLVGLGGSEATAAYQLLLNGTSIITSLNGTGASFDFGLQKTTGNYTVVAFGSNGCSTPMTGGVSITTLPLPATPGSISGQITVCQGASSVIYQVSPVPNATSYSWAVPTGANINAGLNSNKIYVDYSSSAISGPVRVYGSNGCGNGILSADLQIVVNPLPGAPSNIKYIPVNNAICLGDSNVIYEVDPIVNATDYEWMLPAGASIQWGLNTQQIKVRFAANAATGPQIVKVRGKNSCGTGAWSAVYNISVNANPSVYAGIDQNICATGTTLQGSIIPVGGTGKWDLQKGSVVFANANQNNSNLSSVSQGDNILTWTITANGCKAVDTVKIINNMLYVDAGQNQAICSNIYTLQGSYLPTGTTGMWSIVSGSATFVAASQPGTKASNFGYGDNKLLWTVTKNGCNSTDSVIITNYRPTLPDAGGDQNICFDNTLMAGNLPVYGTGQWSVYSGSATLVNPTLRNTQITSITKGKNVFVWTITNQICSLSDTVVIWNNGLDVKAGYDQTLCEDRTTLDASAPPASSIGQWSVFQGSASFFDGKTYNTKVSGLVNGQNKLIWSITKGSCTNTDTVVLTCNMPTVANAGIDQFINGSSTTLGANAPLIGTGKWTVISGAAAFADETLFNTSVSSLNPGVNVLRWTITNLGCSLYDDVTITNGTIEKVDAGQDQTICENYTQLEATRPQYGFGVWTVQKGSANFEDNEAYNTKVTNLAPNVNILRWSVVISGIEFYDTVIIVNNQPTLAVVGPKQSLCADSSMFTGNQPIQGTGKWTIEGGSANIFDINKNNSKVTQLSNGDNQFRWTITKGTCVSSAVLVIANDKPTIADAGLDQSLCDDKCTLMPNVALIGTGEWSVMGGSGSFNGNEVTGLAPGINALRWTIRKNNCSSRDDVQIISHKPTPASAGFNTVVCIDSLYLSANKVNSGLGEFGRWTVMNGAGNFADTTLNTSLIRKLAQGKNVLRWTINNNGCLSYSEIEVNYAFIKSAAGSNITTCDDHVLLNANNASIGIGEWSVIGGSGSAIFVDPTSPNSEVKNLDKGNNILRWTIRNYSCVSTSEMTITNNSPSDAFAGGDQNLCTNTTALMAKPILIGKGVWTVLSGAGRFSDSTAYDATVSSIGIGANTYRWTITNANCVLSDEVVISNNRPLNTNAGIDQTLCNDSTILAANQPLIGKGVWSIVKGAGLIKDAYNPFTTVRKLYPDTNVLRWTVTNKQCVEYKDVKIVNNLPSTASAGADRTICSDRTLLDGNVPQFGKGEWSVISGAGTFSNKNSFGSDVQNLLKGNNILRWKITKQNCISYDDVTINNDSPSDPVAGTTISVCDNTANLNGNKPIIGTPHWSVISGSAIFIDSTQYNTRVVGLGQGSNILRWTITHNKCMAYDVVEVKNNQTNVLAGPDQVVFENTSMLVGNAPSRGIGSWTLDAGSGTISLPYNTESYVTDLGEGANTFSWSVNIDGCVSSDQVQITYYKLPTASFSVSQSDGCPPLTVNFTKTNADDYPISWQFGIKDSISTEKNPVFTYTTPGSYIVKMTVTGPAGKLVSKEKTITVHEVPKAKFEVVPAEVYIPEQQLRCYNYSVNGNSYQWNFGDGNTSTEFNASHTYSDSGLYSVTIIVSTNYRCSDTMTITNAVHVIEKSRIKFPTAFSPNPNGSSNGRYNAHDFSNDVFYPIVINGGLKDYHMEIYNRWGVLLFESSDIDVGWDGYYKNQLMMEDVYIYRISGIYNDGKRFSKTGDILLMKK